MKYYDDNGNVIATMGMLELPELSEEEYLARMSEFEKRKKRQQQLYDAQERKRPLTSSEVAELFIKQNIQVLEVNDETALRMVSFYPEWAENNECIEGHMYQHKSNLYRCITTHTPQTDWTPDAAPSLFVRVSDPAAEYPEWVRPAGAHDAYAMGDKVSYIDKHWVSELDANVYEPGVYGWEEVTDV